MEAEKSSVKANQPDCQRTLISGSEEPKILVYNLIIDHMA